MADNTPNTGTFAKGLRDGLPIGLGYVSVSFTFGILAVTSGLTWLQASLISFSNVTSAGQVAGVGIMAGAGGILAMITSQFIINLRYSLMGISLSQKTDSSMTPLMRVLLAYGITDEIFGVAVSRDHPVNAKYFFGLTVLPILGWNIGTIAGALLGEVLPAFLSNSLSIGIYGMFISIVIPPAKKRRIIMNCAMLSCVLSAMMFYIPAISAYISGGFEIIIAAVLAAVCGVLVSGYEPSRHISFTVFGVQLVCLALIIGFFAPGYQPAAAKTISAGGTGIPTERFVILLLVMAVTTYLVRMIPFALFRRKLTNPKVKAFFDFIPYTVLSAMTFPAILYSTGSVVTAVCGLAVALALSFMEKSLLVVAIGSCIASLIAEVILMFI